MKGKAAEWIMTQAWAIEEEALRLGLEIADRRNEDPEVVAAKLGRPLDSTRTVTVREGVAVLPIEGPIFARANLFMELSGGVSSAILATEFQTALDDPEIRAILLDIDSPGGQVTGIADLATYIYQARTQKPIVAYVGGSGASGAYWLGSAASELVIAPTARVGSVGAVMSVRRPRADGTGPLEFVSSQSPRKRPDPSTEGGKSELQGQVDALGEAFLEAVARNRGTTTETVARDFGKGGILVGKRAVKAGMADRIGTFEETLGRLARGESPTRRQPGPARSSRQVPSAEALAMGWAERALKYMFDNGEAASEDPLAEPPVAPRQVAGPATLRTAVPATAGDEELAKLRKENERLRAESVKTLAEAFADHQVREKKALPNERAGLVTDYTLAALDDARMPLPEGSRVANLTARFAARPAHMMTQETIPSGAGAAILPATDPDPASATEKAAREYAVRTNGKPVASK